MISTQELTTVKNTRPPPDQVLVDIADYVCNYKIKNEQSFDTLCDDASTLYRTPVNKFMELLVP